MMGYARALLLVFGLLAAGAVGCSRSVVQQAVPAGQFESELSAVVGQAASAKYYATDRMTCTAKPFGTQPYPATNIAEVRTVYAWVFCQTSGQGAPISGGLNQVVVHLDGRSTTVDEAPWTTASKADIDRLFPADVRTIANDNQWAENLISSFSHSAPSPSKS